MRPCMPICRSRGVVSLDMETAAIAKVCDERGVAWSVVRAISDRAGDGTVDAEIAGLTHPDGTANPAAVARYLVRHRGALPRLVSARQRIESCGQTGCERRNHGRKQVD